MGGKVRDSRFTPRQKRGGALYDPVLGRIEAAVNDDPDKLISYGMEETYDFIPAHQIRELIRLWDRSDDASRAALISGTAVAVPLKIL